MIELTPQSADDVIVIGASTGGLEALRTIVADLPPRLPAAVLIVMHVGSHDSLLAGLLARATPIPLRFARDGDLLEAGRILIAPPDHHLLIVRHGTQARLSLSRGPRENHARPAIDPLFRTAATVYGARAIGVILTGRMDDGTAGLFAIKACGGRAIVQLPENAVAPEMPASAIENVDVDRVLHLPEIGPALVQMLARGVAPGSAVPAPAWVEIENQFIGSGGDMDKLARIASPSTFTCPECHGSLWLVHEAGPKRYRCHTGHSLTERSLAAQQAKLVEDAVWSAIRSLHEKEKLLRQMADDAMASGQASIALVKLDQAAEAQRSGELLRRMLTGTNMAEPIEPTQTE